ncbi:MAG TPA: HAD-IA family hydrolase [Myxococcota bacterium]|nr:HAD-IA family hydrolase [Myxococcota bacterium]
MSGAPIRAALFDAVGTLLVLREPVGETYARLAAAFDARVPAGRLDEAFARCRARAGPVGYAPGLPLERVVALERAWWRRLVDDTFRSADGAALPRPFEACFERLFEHYGSAAAWDLAPGARGCLEALRARGFATAIASNFDLRLPAVLRGLGLDALLDAVVLPGEVGAPKPARALFDAALARLGVAAEEAVFVGDAPAEDLAGARAAGLRTVDVRTLATLGELPELLARGEPAALETR